MADPLADSLADTLALSTRTKPGAGPTCPGCGKSVDPLRAGHVAIYGGLFLYYCDRGCKAQHLRQLSAPSADEVVTLDPPAVAAAVGAPASSTMRPRLVTVPEEMMPLALAASGVAGPESPIVLMPPAPPCDAELPSAPTPPAPPPTAPKEADASSVEALSFPVPARASKGALSVPPSTLRSPPAIAEAKAPPAPEVKAPPRERDTTERAARAASIVALFGGLLVPASSLAGEGAEAARLPLVGVAALAVVARLYLAERDPADASPLVTALPIGFAALAAVWAHAAGAPHATGVAWFAGLAAAAAVTVEKVVAWARREVIAARSNIARELDAEVRVVRGGDAVRVPASRVKPGEQVVVDAGELVGVDGVVTAGEASVVPWVGAPSEARKAEGDPVVAGARVVTGRLRLTTTWAGPERAWSKLALGRTGRVDVSSPIVRFARAIAERGTPVAALVVAVAAFANGAALPEVLAAACAAVLAVSGRGVVAAAALVHARGQLFALEHGVVYKDAKAFDAAGRVDVAVVCSRGTVLMGEPEIVVLEPLGADSDGAPASRRAPPIEVPRLLALAAGAETASTHPFAAAILRAARARGERPDDVRSATVHAGLGVTGLASTGEPLVVGSRALLLQEKVSVARADSRISELEAAGRSVLLVAVGGKLVGLLALQDGLRAGARAAIQRLLDARIEPVLLSGEARETCETIGRALDIDHIRPEVLPADRGAEVRALAEGGHVVAVIGHPKADDGALGAADVSLAMSSAGATPGEWAVALASDDVRHASLALAVGRAARERARIAVAIGLVPGAVALLALAFGVTGLLVAPLLGAAATVAAIAHARGP